MTPDQLRQVREALVNARLSAIAEARDCDQDRAAENVRAALDLIDADLAGAQIHSEHSASGDLTGSYDATEWKPSFDAWWAENRVATHQIKGSEGFARKVWHAAIKSVSGATDSTSGFYPEDGGSIPPGRATQRKFTLGWVEAGRLQTAIERECDVMRPISVALAISILEYVFQTEMFPAASIQGEKE
jgi:hypothetical protein